MSSFFFQKENYNCSGWPVHQLITVTLVQKIEMLPTTPNTRLNPPLSGLSSRQVWALSVTVGPRAVQSKTQQPVNLGEKRLEMQTTETHTHAFESR